MSPRLALFGLACVAVTLASNHVFARYAFGHGLSVGAAAVARNVATALAMFLVLLAMGRGVLPLPRQFRGTVVLGVLVGAQGIFMQAAVAHLPVGLAVLVFYTFPFLTGVLSVLLGAERATWKLFAALAAAFCGLALAVGAQAGLNLLGVAFGLGASLCFTGAFVFTPRLAPDIPPPQRTFYTFAASALALAVVVGLSGRWELPPNAPAWLGLAGLSACYAAGISGVFLLLPRLGAVETAVGLNLEPVAVILIAWIVLDESLSAAQLAGAALVVAAVLAYQLRRRG